MTPWCARAVARYVSPLGREQLAGMLPSVNAL